MKKAQWEYFSRKHREDFLRNGARKCENPKCDNTIYQIGECQVDHILARPMCRGKGRHLYTAKENLRVVCKRCKGNNLDRDPAGRQTTNRQRLQKILEAYGQEVHDLARGWMEELGYNPDKG